MTALAVLGSRLPPALGSIRFRIAVLTAGALLVIGGILVGAVQVAIAASLDGERELRDLSRPGFVAGEDGRLLRTDTLVVADAQDLERAANASTLRTIRDVSLAALGGLFLVSLAVAWFVAGRVLRPLDRIAAAAAGIDASTLTRRVALDGPDHELKRLGGAIDGMLARLDSAFALQRRYVADAAHELRNPLAVIRTNLDVALAGETARPDVLRSHAGVALRATDRMAGVVSDLLAVSRLEAPGSRNRKVDLAEVAAEAGDELDALAAERGLRIERRLAPGLQVAGDRDAFKRAFANLLDNAVRLAPEGSCIELAGVRANGWIEISVTDEGPGLDPEDQQRVFERFWRGDRSRPGSGLGLALVKQVAESHGGRARVSSSPAGGSIFAIAVPAGQPARETG
jgi:signal transduction histidine kinase